MEKARELIERLCTIPGIDRISAWTVLAEIGLDMSVFGDSKHLASWAALVASDFVVVPLSPEEQAFYGPTLEEALAWCLV